MSESIRGLLPAGTGKNIPQWGRFGHTEYGRGGNGNPGIEAWGNLGKNFVHGHLWVR